MSHTPGVLKERKLEMYGDFSAGVSPAVMATKYGAHLSTIKYHMKQWENAGRPDPRPSEQAAAEPTVQVDVAQVTVPEPQVQESTPAGDNPPATEEQLRQLAAVINGQVDPPSPKLAPPTPAPAAQAKSKEPEWDIKPGQVYEGAVHRVDTCFMLVDIIELADMKGRCPRGRVAASETGEYKSDLRDGRIKEGNVVNVKVLTVNYDSARANLSLSLSISQAPPHPDMPVAETEQEQGERVPVPVQDSVPVPPADRGDSTPQAAIELVSPPAPATAALPSDAPEQPHTGSLCTSCIHRRGPFCPFHDQYGDPVELEDKYKPDRLVDIKVTYGPRPVTSCSAYTADRVG